MGKIKRRDWQYKKRESEAKKPVDPSFTTSVYGSVFE